MVACGVDVRVDLNTGLVKGCKARVSWWPSERERMVNNNILSKEKLRGGCKKQVEEERADKEDIEDIICAYRQTRRI